MKVQAKTYISNLVRIGTNVCYMYGFVMSGLIPVFTLNIFGFQQILQKQCELANDNLTKHLKRKKFLGYYVFFMLGEHWQTDRHTEYSAPCPLKILLKYY